MAKLTKWQQTIIDVFSSQGWTVVDIPCIWLKDSGRNQAPNSRLTPNYEQFLYMQKGTPNLKKQRNAIFEYKTVPQSVRYHLTPKPTKMYEDLISCFAEQSSNVLCAFAGSGSFLHACANLKFDNYIGIDLAKDNQDEFIARTMAQDIGGYDNYIDIYSNKKNR